MFKFLKKGLGLFCLFWTWNVSAADIYWTNAATGDFTNQTKWMTTTVPTIVDDVYVTNRADVTIDWTTGATNANVYFENKFGTSSLDYILNINSSAWWVTNSLTLGGTVGSTSFVTMASGTLVITNAAGTGAIVFGDLSGTGRLTMDGGTILADHLYATNGSGLPLTLKAGTLITRGNSMVSNSSDITMGGAVGSFSWTVGGTNLFQGAGDLRVGTVAGSTGILHIVGPSTLWTNDSGKLLSIGFTAGSTGNQVIITNAGKLHSGATVTVGNAGSSNTVFVAGAGSELRAANITVGSGGAATGNQLIISNQGLVMYQGAGTFNLGSQGSNAFILITDSGSQLIHLGNETRVGSSAYGTSILVSNGGYFRTEANVLVGNNASGASNNIHVTGAGTIWTNVGSYVLGGSGSSNRLTISEGAFSYAGGNVTLGSGSAVNNSVLITGPQSTWSGAGTWSLGSSENLLVISNGGYVQSAASEVGSTGGGTNNAVVVTGSGSRWKLTSLHVGTNSTTKGLGGHVLVADGGTLEIGTSLTTGFNSSGTISNRLGTYEFTTATPTITTNTVDSIILTNGIVSFKGVTTANIITGMLGRITYQGDNTFMLNNSTGILLSAYTFAPGNGTNFQHLTMTEGGTRWQASNTTVNSGGAVALLQHHGDNFWGDHEQRGEHQTHEHQWGQHHGHL